VIRRPIAALLVGVLQIGAMSALLVHVHADGEAWDHHEGASHTHLPAPGAAHGAVIDHQDEGRAMAAQVFVGVAADPFAAPAIAPQAFTIVVPLEVALARIPRVAHAHDPPSRANRPSRAPPAFLS